MKKKEKMKFLQKTTVCAILLFLTIPVVSAIPNEIQVNIEKPSVDPSYVVKGEPVMFSCSGIAQDSEGQSVIIEYRWDFDEGKRYSSNKNAVHVFEQLGTHHIVLRGYAPAIGRYDWDYREVIVLEQLTTAISCSAGGESFDVYEMIINEQINVYGNAVGGRPPYSYNWDFGDKKGYSNEKNSKYVYDEAGTYTINLTVIDRDGREASDTIDIVVYKELSVDIDDLSDIKVNDPIAFIGKVSGGKTPYDFNWDFGDGTTSSEQNPIHTYSTAGEYTITLTVTDNNENTQTSTTTVTVEEGDNIESVEIKDVTGGLSVSAYIVAGNNNYVDWSIIVDGTIFFGGEGTGNIPAGFQDTVRLPFSLGFGKVQITVNANSLTKTYEAFMIGPFFLNMQEA